MLTIGLTGGSGAGKGYVSALFRRGGIESLDTDLVARAVVEPGKPCLRELTQEFGESILREDGTLNRRALAAIVFSDRERLAALNRITHAHILAECRIWLKEREEAGDFAAIIDAPQLYESGFDSSCDLVAAVIADRETRIARILRRDSITREEALRRIENQKPDEFFLEKADFILRNNDDEHIEEQVEALCRLLREKAAQP